MSQVSKPESRSRSRSTFAGRFMTHPIDGVRDTLALIKGAGDLASGVAARLHRSGFPVVMTELPEPTMVRRAVSFGEAVYEGEFKVEDIVARRVADAEAARAALAERVIPVWVDPGAACRHLLRPAVVVDAILAKHNTGTAITDAALVIGLGPGFTAGADCHAVIETNRGHWLGRVLWQGSAQPDTRAPGKIAERQDERVLRAPVAGIVQGVVAIGDRVEEGQLIATVDGHALHAVFAGVVRGLIRSGLWAPAELKIGDVDPRGDPIYCFYISEKSLAIGGGVLEAILSSQIVR